MPPHIPHPSPTDLIGYEQSTSSRPPLSESGSEALSKQSENLIQTRPPHQHGSAVLDTSIDELNSMPKMGLAGTKKPLPSLPTALPCLHLQDDASKFQAAMEDDDGLLHDGDEEDHETSMDEDGVAASADVGPQVRKQRSRQPSSTRRKRPTHGALPAGRTDSDTITDLHIMKLIRAFHRQRIAARLTKTEQRSQAPETWSSTQHGKRASMSRPSTTSTVKEVIEQEQRTENENVIQRRRVEAMQREMDIPKSTVVEPCKERYPPINTEGLRDTSPQWMDILNRLKGIERENHQLKGESQQSRDENCKIRTELQDAFKKIQGASKEHGRRLERVEFSLNQAELAHWTHAERLATVESQVWDEAKGRRSELQRRQEVNEQTEKWIKLVETKVDWVLARPPSFPTEHTRAPDRALSDEVNEALMDAKIHGDRAHKAANEAMDAMQEVKILVHDVQSKSGDMASWSAAMKDTANVVKRQEEAIQDTVTDVETKIKMAIGSMEAEVERSRTIVDFAKTEFVQLDQERQAEMDQAMKLIKQHTAALGAMVGKLHTDMETTSHDMRNVEADATNKLEAIHKSKDDMAAKVDEMKQLHIDIIKYAEKKRRESGIGSERRPSPGIDTDNPLHKKFATLEQLDRVKRAFSTELNEVNKKMTAMEEEFQKVENKNETIGRREEKSKLHDGSDKLLDLR